MSRELAKSFLAKRLSPFFSKKGFLKKGYNYLKISNKELLKGYSLKPIDSALHINWFIMPLLPYSRVIVLDVGERIRDIKGIGTFLIDAHNQDQLIVTLSELLSSTNKILDEINSIRDFYNYFYKEENWQKLEHIKSISTIRHYERLIYSKIYLGLSVQNELKYFYQSLNKIENHSKWMLEVKKNIDEIVAISDKEIVKDHLDKLIGKSIIDLGLERYQT